MKGVKFSLATRLTVKHNETMNKFLYLISILYCCISTDCFGGEHPAYAVFKFCNSSDEEIILQPISLAQQYKPEGFREFSAQKILPRCRISFDEKLTKYEEVKTPEDSQIMLKINVVTKDGINVGEISLVRGISPDPCFSFKNLENGLGFKLCFQRLRFGGGGARTIEIVRTTDR